MTSVKKVQFKYCPHCEEHVVSSHLCTDCPLRWRYCFNDSVIQWAECQWAECLCSKIKWNNGDPEYKTHVCTARCKCCKQVFESGYKDEVYGTWVYGLTHHFKNCPLREEMIKIYKLKGDRTEEEWIQFKELTKDDPNLEAIKFEEEYAKWKESL